jgi:hypothetical protein
MVATDGAAESAVAGWSRALGKLHRRIGPRFARSEARVTFFATFSERRKGEVQVQSKCTLAISPTTYSVWTSSIPFLSSAVRARTALISSPKSTIRPVT